MAHYKLYREHQRNVRKVEAGIFDDLAMASEEEDSSGEESPDVPHYRKKGSKDDDTVRMLEISPSG